MTNESSIVFDDAWARETGTEEREEAKQQSHYLKTLLVNTQHSKVSQPSICFFHAKFHFTYALFDEMCFTLSKKSNTIFPLCEKEIHES